MKGNTNTDGSTRLTLHLALHLEGSNEIRRFTPAIDRSSDLQANSTFLLAVASQAGFCDPVHQYGVRSCLPLRDSSGFKPDSLVIAKGT
jgi:hypothetical protein